METSQNLAIESFSLNWLTNKKLCFDSLCEQPLRKSFEFSDEESTKPSQNSIFFDFPLSKSNSTIVHADEIFSHGLILPKYSERAKKKVLNTSYSGPSSPTSSFIQRDNSPSEKIHIQLFRNWRKTSKKIFRKYFYFFKPSCREVGCARKSGRVDDFDGKYKDTRRLNNSPQFSPLEIRYTENWSGIKKGTRKIKSMGNTPYGSPPRPQSRYTSDLRIDEAILHCKKSFGMCLH